MKNKVKALIVTSLLIFIFSCNTKDDIVNDIEPAGTFETIGVKVILPKNTNVMLDHSSLVSLSEKFNVDNSGNSKVILNKDGRSLAFLFDENDNIILAGFVNASNTEISVRSTLITNLYLTLGTVFLPEEIKQEFFKNIDTFPDIDQMIEEASNKFVSDPKYLFSKDFADVLKTKIDELYEDKPIIDINTKSIRADGSDIRSGIQLKEVDAFSFSLVNTYRRRAHAFVYKKSVKKEDGGEQVLISDYNAENPEPVLDTLVSSPKAIREFFGVIADWAGGTGINFAAAEAGPLKLDINDDEKEVLYHCRVIGTAVGIPNIGSMTTKEEKKLFELVVRTFVFEIALPVFLDFAGHSDILNGLDEKTFKGFADLMQVSISSLASVEEPLWKGDYGKAFDEFRLSFYNNGLGGKAPDIIKALLDGIVAVGVKKNPDYFVQNSAKAAKIVDGFTKYTKIADIFLKFVDYARIRDANLRSNFLEQWDVKVSKNPVTIVPKEALAVQGEEKTFKAIVKNGDLSGGQSYEYNWSTTGKYGVIRDEFGKEGVSFTSSRDEIQYFSSNTIDLPNEAFDDIFVEVYLKEGQSRTKINRDTAKVEIKPLGFKIVPDGVTIQGGRSLALYLKETDGSNPLDNPTHDYKFIWDTSAKFGLFNGSQSSVSKINDNRILYKALEEEKEGTETVTAAIYAKRKGTNDSYRFVDKIEAGIEIENDPNCDNDVKALEVIEVQKEINYSPTCTHTWGGRVAVTIKKDPDAKKYTVEFKDLYSPIGGGHFPSYKVTWTNEAYDDYDVIDNGNTFTILSNVRNGANCNSNPNIPKMRAYLAQIEGYATVKICY